jgi:hypothetical protein
MNATESLKPINIEEDQVFFTAIEIAEQKKLHPDTIRKLFQDEPGVIRLGSPGGRGRRQRYTLRIPKSVADRVFGRFTVRG